MRRKFIAGNWKMNKTVPESVQFARDLVSEIETYTHHDILICVPFTALVPVHDVVKGSNVKLGAQNMHYADSGAYTGEISASMLETAGCDYVIIGHSERRQYFGETNEILNKKMLKVVQTALLPIFCVGEVLEQRKAGDTERVVEEQIRTGLQGLSASDLSKVTIAYEPVWAIGTGETATPDQAEEVHKHIRRVIKNLYDENIANTLRIQYGGSVNPSNTVELLQRADIDGALIGGASLKVESFVEMIKIADRL
ncbi:triose-phosphate isomerase [candidate division KSB1 bacterium]|nr:triose-phosphate isomerase [candidate division KSB1 bacterium]